MNYLRDALSAASQYYRDINPSTLTGAIDVIVVRRTVQGSDAAENSATNDGNDTVQTAEELICSPFHVRFGKWQVLRPVDKKVKVMVNGREIPFGMKIGDAGEAFFVFETDNDVPEDLITSPLLEATRPDEPNERLEVGRPGQKEENGHDDGQQRAVDSEKLGEPEPLDLDSPSDTTPLPSGLAISRPEIDCLSPTLSNPNSEPETEGESSPVRPSSLLNRTASLGKAIVKATVEADRYEREQIRDRAEAARNAATYTYENFFRGGESQPGDEALPRVKYGEGEPPEVVYSHDIVFDASGYHGQGKHPQVSKEPGANSSENSAASTTGEETDDYDSYEGRSTPRSGDPSTHATPTQSPDTSRSPSPQERTTLKDDKGKSLPTYRAASEPPDAERQLDGSPQTAYSWEWGAFPTPSPMKSSFSLESLETHRSLSVPPEVPPVSDTQRPSPPRPKTGNGYLSLPDLPTSDIVSFYGDGAELSASETNGRKFLLSIGGRTYSFELSISEELAQAEGGGSGDELLDERRFRDGQVSFRRFIKYPGVVNDKSLVIKWNDKYVVRKDKSLLFDCLIKWREVALAKPVNAKALEEEEPLSSSDEQEPEPGMQTTAPKKSSSSWVRWWRSSRTEAEAQQSQIQLASAEAAPKANKGKMEARRPSLVSSNSAPLNVDNRGTTPVPFPTMSESKTSSTSPNESRSASRERKKRFAKTLRLTSDQLKQLDLKPGKNIITFSLSASGATACTASIFLWEGTDSIVVSDIDGTITKSDALGHVFTMIGRDWTHIGVAKLYTDIARNGYKILYLTSRAIGQADSTRYYLKSIKQNNYQLPEGPVIMSPDRLIASFHREVIMRKPEVFKMACLRDIQRLFGEGKNPFYAGFGNRITDALSYRSVNVPSQRIFTIDSTGEVKMELLEVAGYKSSYIHLTDLVDQMFPPIHRKTVTEYSDVNYWKTPIPDIPLPADLTFEPVSPALSARSDSSMLTLSRLRNFSLRQSTSSFFQATPRETSPERDGNGFPQMSSLERLSNRNTRSTETLMEHAWPDDGDDERGRDVSRDVSRSMTERGETSVERRARKRLSLTSMPGSLDGSEADFETDEEERGDEEVNGDAYDPEDGEEHYGGDPEEAAEEGFDEDLLATGEMESVPFL